MSEDMPPYEYGHLVKLDSYHAHEALDRTHVILVMIDTVLRDHPFILANPDIQIKLDEASTRLASVYQMIGAAGDRYYKNEDK